MREYILVLDSGLGGVSVLNELKKQMPNKSFIYYADSKNAPYGNKSKKRIKAFVFNAVKSITKEYCIELLVIACNTASSVCLDELREEFNFPIIGVSPEIGMALRENRNSKILVMCTKSTWKNNKKIKQLKKKYKKQIIFLKPKKLAYLIDENMKNLDTLKPYLHKVLKKKHRNVNAVVLGCTHYNFLQKQLEPFFKVGIKFYCDKKVVSDRAYLLLDVKVDESTEPKLIVKSSVNNKEYLQKIAECIE